MKNLDSIVYSTDKACTRSFSTAGTHVFVFDSSQLKFIIVQILCFLEKLKINKKMLSIEHFNSSSEEDEENENKKKLLRLSRKTLRTKSNLFDLPDTK